MPKKSTFTRFFRGFNVLAVVALTTVAYPASEADFGFHEEQQGISIAIADMQHRAGDAV